MTGQGLAAQITPGEAGDEGAQEFGMKVEVGDTSSLHPASDAPYGSMEGTTFISVQFLTHHLYDRFDQR